MIIEDVVKKTYTGCISIIIFLICVFNVRFLVLNAGSAEQLEACMQEHFIYRDYIFDINGALNRSIMPMALYKEGETIVRMADGSIILPRQDMSVEEQVKGVIILNDFCKHQGIDFLYVNFPAQCGTDQYLMDNGVYSYASSISNRMLGELEKQKISYMNLSEFDGFHNNSNYRAFYLTDHHWTTYSGLNAAREILNYCNMYFSSGFEMGLIADNRFRFTKMEDCWFGEIGKYVSYGWSNIMDDFTIIEPKYETEILIELPEHGLHANGNFDDLIMKERFYEKYDKYNTPSFHYAYLGANYGFQKLTNNRNPEGKNILFIKDSFGLVTAPFMLLPARSVALWDMRYNSHSIMKYIEDNDIDIVIVGYTEGSSIAKPAMYDFK